MDTKALRQKILDLAIRGKLVPQDPNDEPASVLLERIRAQKQQMVREGKLKSKDIKDDTVIFVGEDNLHYEKLPDGSVKCIEDEIPFDLPESWAWCRIKNICTIGTGATPLKSNSAYYANGTIPWITSAATSQEIITTPADYITERAIAETNCSIYPIGTLIIAMYGEGKTRGQISELGIEACTNQACAALQILADDVRLSQYVKSYFQYSYENLRQKAKGGQQPNLNQTIIAETLIAIPPYQETKRIMDSVYQCIDQINTIEESLESICTSIENAKKRILDLAIHGQLVPQNPADEPATVLLDRIRAEKEELIRQGKIKRDKKESVIFRGDDNSYYEKVGDQRVCIDDDLPYSLPEGWVWCELQDCCIKKIKRGRSPKYADNGHVLSFAQKCNQKTGGINMGLALLIDDSTACRYEDDEYLQDGDIVINSTGTGTLGRVGIYRATDNLAGTPVVPDSHVTVVRVSSLLDPLYLFYCLKSMQSRLETLGEGSTNQKELKPLTVQQLRIPIPPIAEQNEIVKQIVALFGHLDAIATDLT